MRTLMQFLLIILFMGYFTPEKATAQAIVDTNNSITFYYKNDVGLLSLDSKSIITPSGNILKTARFQLPDGHPLIPDFSIKIIKVRMEVEIDGKKVELWDEMVAINRKGQFSVSYHLNGAGNALPKGW